MKKVAITGANGFLGKSLKDYLKKDFIVFGISRRKSKLRKEEFILNDSKGPILRDVDILVHCAAKVHDLSNKSDKDLNEYIASNLLLTEQLVKDAIKNQVKKFVFISTIKVNGEYTKKNQPFNSKSKNKPTDPYALSKYQAENLIQKLCETESLDFVIIRSPLIYGPGVKANFLNLLKIINKGIPLPFGSIRNLRSFIYIGNLVHFIKFCFSSERASNNIFLVSDPDPISTKNLVKNISNNLNSNNLIFKIPVCMLLVLGFLLGKSKQVKRLVDSLEIDYSETSNFLKWKAPFSTYEGLKNTSYWYKKNLNRK